MIAIVSYIVFLLVWTLLLSLPLLVLVALLRRRLPRTMARALIAIAFAAATFYTLYRIEWFDVWRHGVPSVGFILRVYGPYVLVAAGLGWWCGGLLAGRHRPRSTAIESM